MPWVLLAPVVAMLSAAVLLDQRPNAAEAGGGLVMVVGVLVALRSGRTLSRRPRAAASTTLEPVGVGLGQPVEVIGEDRPRGLG